MLLLRRRWVCHLSAAQPVRLPHLLQVRLPRRAFETGESWLGEAHLDRRRQWSSRWSSRRRRSPVARPQTMVQKAGQIAAQKEELAAVTELLQMAANGADGGTSPAPRDGGDVIDKVV